MHHICKNNVSMLEIFVLIYLNKKIRRIVKEKGLTPRRYTTTLLLLWFSLELLFISIGMKFTGDPITALPVGMIGAAIGGYLGYKLAVNAEPEAKEEI